MKKTTKHIYVKSRVLMIVPLAVILLWMLISVPPNSWEIISIFAIVTSSLAFIVSSFFFSDTSSILIGIFFFLFFIISGLVGFDIVNTLLLLCFIIGVKFLVQ
ncbi:MAG: hypothetical protein WC489_03285 [Patescibacteria group bacterium]